MSIEKGPNFGGSRELPPDYEETRKKTNEEGWEENAAVIIGKKEEMEMLREKLETSGETKDLGTYIKMHKENTLPNSEITDEELRKELLEGKGAFFNVTSYGRPFLRVEYIDKDGNLSEVEIRADKIADIREGMSQARDQDDRDHIIKKGLLELGFREWWKDDASKEAIKKYEEGAKKQLEEELKHGLSYTATKERTIEESKKNHILHVIKEMRYAEIQYAKEEYKKRLEEKAKKAKRAEFDF